MSPGGKSAGVAKPLMWLAWKTRGLILFIQDLYHAQVMLIGYRHPMRAGTVKYT